MRKRNGPVRTRIVIGWHASVLGCTLIVELGVIYVKAIVGLGIVLYIYTYIGDDFYVETCFKMGCIQSDQVSDR